MDNPDLCHDHSEIPDEFPNVEEILQFQQNVRNRARSLLEQGRHKAIGRPISEALWLGFEHEAMHLETFLYMLIQSERILPPPRVALPDFKNMAKNAANEAIGNDWFEIPEQVISIGLDDPDPEAVPESFGWDNEKPRRTAKVKAFSAKARPITNGEYARYLEVKGINKIPACWLEKESNGTGGDESPVVEDSNASPQFLGKYSVRTVFGPVPLQWATDWPVTASFDELKGYADWTGCRLPSLEEVQSIYRHSATLKSKQGNGVHPLMSPNG